MALPENKAEYANFLCEQLKQHAPLGKDIVTSGVFYNELEVWSSNSDLDIS